MSTKTIIVTGASRGIGLAIAKHLLDHSHNVVVLARSEDVLEKIQAQYPQQVRVVVGDMSNLALAQKAVDVTIQEFGRMDGIVINHGVLTPVNSVADCDIEAWKHNFDVNFFSAVAFAKAALPSLRKSNGRIILTSSGAAVTGYTGWGAYGASKAALNHLTKTLQAEEPDVITIAIRPGAVDTEMQRELREEHHPGMQEKDRAKFLALHKNGNLLKPELPGHVMAKLVVDGPKDLSGEFISWNDKRLEGFQTP